MHFLKLSAMCATLVIDNKNTVKRCNNCKCTYKHTIKG